MTAIRGIAFAALLVLTPLLLMAHEAFEQPVSQYSFTLPLIHRDAQNSPLHDPKQSYYEQIRSAVARSISRPKLLSKRQYKNEVLDAEAINIITAKGEYLMNISIGKPAFPVMAMVDTVNDFTWTQCQPWKSLDEQRASLFDPRKSSTFRPLSRFSTHPINNSSGYMITSRDWTREVSYNTISSRSGPIGEDTITLGTFEFKDVYFGCKFSKQGAFDSIGSGIIGMGFPYFIIRTKFSYCLTPLSDEGTKSSKIHFGENSIVSSSDDVVSTEMFRSYGDSFSLNLYAITVGGKRVIWPTIKKKRERYYQMIIDLGTPLLMLPSRFYYAVESEIRNQINAKPVGDPSNQLKLCYNSDEFNPPELVSNFEGGDVKLNDFNAWLATSDNVLCFAAAPSSIGIYGNLAQRNYLVEYDLEDSKISFKPANCGD